MRLNRRNVLIGIGTVAVGSGAALGSGAFTQVSAERTMTVDVAGDANAFLALEAVASTSAVTDTGGTDSNELEIDLSDSLTGAAGQGVNDNATTYIGELDDTVSPPTIPTAAFTITNNGADPVDVSVSVSGNNPGILNLPTFVASGDHTTPPDFSTVTDLQSNNIADLVSGGAAEVVVEIDTTGSVSPGDDAITSITFEATSN